MLTPPNSPGKKDDVDIIDLRSSTHGISLKKELEASLSADPPRFPSLLLWDEKGLQQFEAITYSPGYYLTICEIELLRQHSNELALQIAPSSIVLELGSGCLRKTGFLLGALEAQHKPVDYYALDLNHSELERNLTDVSPSSFSYVRCHGLLGTYDDSLSWLQELSLLNRPKCILSLGSTIGSSSLSGAAKFLGDFVEAVKCSTSQGMFIVGVDGCKDGDQVWHAYNDEQGCNSRFISNILHNANRCLEYDAFDPEEWTVQGQWNKEKGRHDQFLIPVRNMVVNGVKLKKGEGLLVVSSHKFDEEDQKTLWEDSDLQLQSCWRTEPHKYTLNVLSVKTLDKRSV